MQVLLTFLEISNRIALWSLFIIFFLPIPLVSQSPELINYQAIARDVQGNPLINQPIDLRISIHKTVPSGTIEYREEFLGLSTNSFGLFSLKIGNGAPLIGTLSSIDWGGDSYFIEVELRVLPSPSFNSMGTSQLVSVPFALYAKDVENNDDADSDSTNEIQVLGIMGDTLSISNGNSVVLATSNSIWSSNNDTIFYNAGNVGIGSTSPSAKLEVNGDLIRKIAYASGNGPDDVTDNGRIISRTLNFTKRRNDTQLRISYTDNLRCYTPLATGTGCRWEIKIDSMSCPNQPLVYDYYAFDGGENSHRSRAVVGYCSGINAGTHQIQIWVGPVGNVTQGDCYTGWSNSTWVIEVEEVF